MYGRRHRLVTCYAPWGALSITAVCERNWNLKIEPVSEATCSDQLRVPFPVHDVAADALELRKLAIQCHHGDGLPVSDITDCLDYSKSTIYTALPLYEYGLPKTRSMVQRPTSQPHA